MVPNVFTTPLPAATFVVFDVETTGLDAAKGARVVEVGALKLAAGRATDHFLTLVDPGIPVPAGATAVHGLADADLAGQPKISDILPDFLAFVGDAALVAHNLKFDLSFLARATAEAALAPLPNPTVDLLGLARHYHAGLPSYNLESLTSYFGLANPAPHRSLGDCAVESELFLSFVAEAGRRGDAATVGDFVLLSRGLGDMGIPPETATALDWAIAAGATVAVVYAGSSGTRRRRITPYHLKVRDGVVQLSAYCCESGERRVFRVDRLEIIAEERDAPGVTP